jgi:predicted nuclease of predicted toxin-antitoxin system
MAQLYLDECVPLPLAHILMQQGHDVTTAMQLGLRKLNDPFHLKYAAAQERILITTNQSDFRLLHRFWITMQAWEVLASPHQGILSTAIRQLNEQAFAQAITDHLSRQGTVINTFWMWDPATGWHADKW